MKQQTIKLASQAFQDGMSIPTEYTCDGSDTSPDLSWTGIPSTARSLAIICEDPDAPGGMFTHWLVFNIDPGRTGLPRAFPATADMPDGTRQGANGFGRSGYGGPCPPGHHPIGTTFESTLSI